MVRNCTNILTGRFEISRYSLVKLARKLEGEIVGNVYFSTESLPVFKNQSFSLNRKSFVWNATVKEFLCQSFSLLFVGDIPETNFVIDIPSYITIMLYTHSYSVTLFFKIFIRPIETIKLILFHALGPRHKF